VNAFRVDSVSGQVIVTSALDYWTRRYYQFTVVAEVFILTLLQLLLLTISCHVM